MMADRRLMWDFVNDQTLIIRVSKLQNLIVPFCLFAQYFGWGLEDDEFYQRIKRKGIQVNCVQQIHWLILSLLLTILLPLSLF